MKGILRNYLINLSALAAASQVLPTVVITDGIRGLATATLALMIINILLIPFIKILLLPLNLLTLGLFSWLTNVLALYLLVRTIPVLQISPYYFPGFEYNGFIVPSLDLSIFQVSIVASIIIGTVINFLKWLTK